eukprot:jgi/Ulvmu1/9407/UM051_0035.1
MASRTPVLSTAVAALVVLATPHVALADAGDSFCGAGLQYLVALRCGEAGPVVLECVPDALRGDACTLPNTSFGRAICRSATGESVEPTLVAAATGCYSVADFDFEGLGVTFSDDLPAPDNTTSPAVAAALFCLALPATIDPSALAAFDSSDSFEGPDPLAPWTVDTSADPETSIRVVCIADDVANETVAGAGFLRRADATFTDLLDMADDGDCAVVVRAGCSEIMGDYGTPGTNSLTRQFRVFNRGCVEGEMAYELMFAVAFDDRERCSATATVNDTVVVTVATGGTEVVAAEFVSCAEGDSPEWQTVSVDLGLVPLGTVISPTFTVESTNDEDCFLDSFVVIDDISIMPKT